MPSLYLNGHQTRVHLESRRLEVERLDDAGTITKRLQVPIRDVDRAVFVGRVQAHMGVIDRLLRENVPVTFVSGRGEYLGTAEPPLNGNGLLRLRQYQLAGDAQFALAASERVVHCKIRNCRRVLQRLCSSRTDPLPDVQSVCEKLRQLFNQTAAVKNLDELRGVEGYAAKLYFSALSPFFPKDMPFTLRSRRPPADEANALLSWTYTIVLSEIMTAVCVAGLDPCLGFLHGLGYGRPSLPLDLLEPYRAPLADLLVLHILNHGIIKKDQFERSEEDGGVLLGAEGRAAFFVQYEQVMERLFSKTKGGPHTTFRRAIRDDVYSLIASMQKSRHFEPFLMP